MTAAARLRCATATAASGSASSCAARRGTASTQTSSISRRALTEGPRSSQSDVAPGARRALQKKGHVAARIVRVTGFVLGAVADVVDDRDERGAQRARCLGDGLEADLRQRLESWDPELLRGYPAAIADRADADHRSAVALDLAADADDRPTGRQQVLDHQDPLVGQVRDKARPLEGEAFLGLVGPHRRNIAAGLAGAGECKHDAARGRARDRVELIRERPHQLGADRRHERDVGEQRIHVDVARTVLAALVDEVAVEQDRAHPVEFREDIDDRVAHAAGTPISSTIRLRFSLGSPVVIARPITSRSAPAASAVAGVSTRAWSPTSEPRGRMPGTLSARPSKRLSARIAVSSWAEQTTSVKPDSSSAST